MLVGGGGVTMLWRKTSSVAFLYLSSFQSEHCLHFSTPLMPWTSVKTFSLSILAYEVSGW